MAWSSGARGLEAAVLLTPAEAPAPADVATLREFGGQDVTVIIGDPAGRVTPR